MIQKILPLVKGVHLDVATGSGLPEGEPINIQNVDADEVWVYESEVVGVTVQGCLLRRGEGVTTQRGARGVWAVTATGAGTISTGPVSAFQSVPVDNEPLALREGRQFRAVRKITVPAATPLWWKFSAGTDFELIEQQLSTSEGDLELTVYRSTSITEDTPFTATVPIFGKNGTDNRRRYNGLFYEKQVDILTGGTVTVSDEGEYVDYDRGKTSNATAQQTSVGGSENSLRMLPANTYYLRITSLSGTSEGRFALAWTEFV